MLFFNLVLHLAIMTHFDRTKQIEDDDHVGGCIEMRRFGEGGVRM